MKKYTVELTDINTGACSPVDTICVDDDYTEEDYRNDCSSNGWDIPDNNIVVFVPIPDDLFEIAATLYDGGWRSEDGDDLKSEYGLTEEETERLCEILDEMSKQ